MTSKRRKSKVKSSKRRKSKVKSSKRRKSKVKSSKRKKSKVGFNSSTLYSLADPLSAYASNYYSQSNIYNLEELLRIRLYTLVSIISGKINQDTNVSNIRPLKIIGCGNRDILTLLPNQLELISIIQKTKILLNVKEISLECYWVTFILPYITFQNFSNLDTLKLSGMSFNETDSSNNIFGNITYINTLTKLTLNLNGITQIPHSLARLTNLTFLDISLNYLIGNAGLYSICLLLPDLIVLKVRKCGITKLPDNFNKLNKLQEFKLTDNEKTNLSLEDFMKILTISLNSQINLI